MNPANLGLQGAEGPRIKLTDTSLSVDRPQVKSCVNFVHA